MQSYQPEFNQDLPEIEPDFFVADSKKKLKKLMNSAAKQKSKMGYKVKKRTRISLNDFCPCDSGEKFELCCMNKAITQ